MAARPRRRPRLAALLLVAVALSGGPASGAGPASSPREGSSLVEGLWEGLLLVEPRAIEVGFAVDLARDPGGDWVGTYDQPDAGLRFVPFDRIEVEERRVRLELTRVFPQAGVRRLDVWEGALSPDGRTIEGTLAEGDHEPRPFVLRWIGPPGSERAVPEEAPVTPLSPGGGGLGDRFNGDRGSVRLLAFLSPECSACLAGAGVIQRYVLEAIDDPDLRVYVVWGPMLGHETEERGGPATTKVPNPRAHHFWLPDQSLAHAFEAVLELPEGATAWDTYLLFPPGTAWTGGPPEPVSFMHLRGPGFPEDRRLDGEALAEEVRRLLER